MGLSIVDTSNPGLVNGSDAVWDVVRMHWGVSAVRDEVMDERGGVEGVRRRYVMEKGEGRYALVQRMAWAVEGTRREVGGGEVKGGGGAARRWMGAGRRGGGGKNGSK